MRGTLWFARSSTRMASLPVAYGLVLCVALQLGCDRPTVGTPRDATKDSSEPAVSADITLPVVSGGGVIPMSAPPSIEVTATEVRVQGRGVPVSAEIPADRSGLWEPYRHLEEILRAVEAPSGKAVIACDSSVPYHVIFRVVQAVERVWGNRSAVAARRDGDGGLVSVPFYYGDRGSQESSLRLVVSYSPNEIRLWSISGKEGDVQAAKLVLPHTPNAYRELTAALSPVVAKHFSKGRATEADFAIFFSPTVDTTTHALVAMGAAVGATQAGEPLFPRVNLMFTLGNF